MVVLINGYSGVLTSLLTIPKLNPIVNTMKEVTESKELRVTVEKNLPFSKIFLVCTQSTPTFSKRAKSSSIFAMDF